MPYKVANEFIDEENKDHHYTVNDEYLGTDEKRIKSLSKKHPKYRRVFIEETSNKKPSAKK